MNEVSKETRDKVCNDTGVEGSNETRVEGSIESTRGETCTLGEGGDENTPIYENDECVFTNPNTFERLILVLECIQKKTKTFENFTSCVTINEDNTVTVHNWDIKNVRQFILMTVDGIPHKMMIEVINNCFKCKECDRNLSLIMNVNHYNRKYNHKTIYKCFSNIGGLHLHMNMLRSFVV